MALAAELMGFIGVSSLIDEDAVCLPLVTSVRQVSRIVDVVGGGVPGSWVSTTPEPCA